MRQYIVMDDLSLALQNLIRIGTIHDVMYSHPPRVRVATGNLITNWIPWTTWRAGKTKNWAPLTIGEQVILLSPGGDLTASFAIGSIYSDNNVTPSNDENKTVVIFPDEATIEYDHSSGTLSISGVKKLAVTAKDEVDFNAKTIKLTAASTVDISAPAVSVDGVLSQSGGSASFTGDMNITGNVTQVGGSLSSNGVVLDEHIHPGVQPGGAKTGEPE